MKVKLKRNSTENLTDSIDRRVSPLYSICVIFSTFIVMVYFSFIAYQSHPVNFRDIEALMENQKLKYFSTRYFQSNFIFVKNVTYETELFSMNDKKNYKDTTPNVECSVISDAHKFDCYPEFYFGNKEKCEARGCCWQADTEPNSPYCYYPKDYPGYTVTGNIDPTPTGYTARLIRKTKSPWPQDIMELQLDFIFISDDTLRFRIFDPKNARYEVPIPIPTVTKEAANPQYKISVTNEPFRILVIRAFTQDLLFDTENMGPLIFSNQYIEISTKLPSQYIYGLGERRGTFLPSMNWKKFTFWAHDTPPSVSENLYGTHPFYLQYDGKLPSQQASGILLLNSNAMEVDLQPLPALTYRTIGGVLDFFIFMGPTADSVIQQYTKLIGRPFMPPYWALGFHLCRWGYGNSTELLKVIDRNREALMPYDTQWNDIDYMDRHLDWTYDINNYSRLPDIVQNLHDYGQHYVIIVDPGISNTQPRGDYAPYDDGIKEKVFVMKGDGSGPIIGEVWPGTTVFPDFTNPNSSDYWYKLASQFHAEVPFDGLWTDMNEPSNFKEGSVTGCPNNTLNYPPFVPPGIEFGLLPEKTLCLSAKQHASTHYNVHSLYGHFEAKVTHLALNRLLKKRSIVISRSTFVSTGRYAGHWTGDNRATWEDLCFSISAILNFQLFGIPFVGADICGFSENTTPELCTRWMQLGAFYPFMRNHNSIGNMDQDPAAFDLPTQYSMRIALNTRYRLLPFLYTLLYRSHVAGSTVARPLFFRYQMLDTMGIDRQFMWGDALLITPVLDQGATSVVGYFPDEIWYDYYTGKELSVPFERHVTLKAPIDHINVHMRGGAIIPVQEPAVTTTISRTQALGLVIALDNQGAATGELYVDDGESLESPENGNFTLVTVHVVNNTITTDIVRAVYQPDIGSTLGNVWVYGLHANVSSVIVNQHPGDFRYNSTTQLKDPLFYTHPELTSTNGY